MPRTTTTTTPPRIKREVILISDDDDDDHQTTSPPPPATLPSHFAAAYTFSGSSSTSSPTSSSAPLRRTARTHRQAARPSPATLVALPSSSSSSSRRNAATPRRDVSYDLPTPSPSPSPTPSASTSASPNKRKRIRRPVDDPEAAEGSRYADYHAVPDHITVGNDVLLCGINPGLTSSKRQHHFAGPTNHFYPALHLANLTSRRMKPAEDHLFPTLRPFSLGLTNIGQRPTAEASELTRKEIRKGVPVFLRKVAQYRPRTVAFVGKGIGEVVGKAVHNHQRGGREGETVEMPVPRGMLLAFQPDSPTEDDHAPGDSTSTSGQTASTRRSTGNESPRKKIRRQWKRDDEKDDTGYGIMPFVFRHDGPYAVGSGETRDVASALSSSARGSSQERQLKREEDDDDPEPIQATGVSAATAAAMVVEGHVDIPCLPAPPRGIKQEPTPHLFGSFLLSHRLTSHPSSPSTPPDDTSILPSLPSSSFVTTSKPEEGEQQQQPIDGNREAQEGEGEGEGEYTFFFVSPSTSARVTTHFLNDKAKVLKHLARMVGFLQRQQRQQRRGRGRGRGQVGDDGDLASGGDVTAVEGEEEREGERGGEEDGVKMVRFQVIDSRAIAEMEARMNEEA